MSGRGRVRQVVALDSDKIEEKRKGVIEKWSPCQVVALDRWSPGQVRLYFIFFFCYCDKF